MKSGDRPYRPDWKERLSWRPLVISHLAALPLTPKVEFVVGARTGVIRFESRPLAARTTTTCLARILCRVKKTFCSIYAEWSSAASEYIVEARTCGQEENLDRPYKGASTADRLQGVGSRARPAFIATADLDLHTRFCALRVGGWQTDTPH